MLRHFFGPEMILGGHDQYRIPDWLPEAVGYRAPSDTANSDRSQQRLDLVPHWTRFRIPAWQNWGSSEPSGICLGEMESVASSIRSVE